MITTRDESIDIITSNLIMAGCLLPKERGIYMLKLMKYDNILLGLTLAESRRMLDMSLEMLTIRSKN